MSHYEQGQINDRNRGLYVDLKIHDGDEDDDIDDSYGINLKVQDEEEEGRRKVKRIYDAKYKIPPNKKLVEYNIDQLISRKSYILKHLRRYKQATNIITTLLMGASAICIVMMYLY